MKTRPFAYLLVVAVLVMSLGLILPGCSQTQGDKLPVLSALSFRDALTVGDLERNPQDPYLKVAPSGEIYFSWTEQEPGKDGDRNFLISTLDHTGALASAVRQINDQPGELSGHGGENLAKFTVNAGNGIVGVWSSPLGEHQTGQQRTSFAGRTGAFSPATDLNDDDRMQVPHAFSAIATSPNGKIYATWIDGRNRQILGYAERKPGSNKRGPKRIYEEGHAQLMMAVSEDGGKTWGKNYPITDFRTCECCRPTLVFLDGGDTVAVSYRLVAEEFLRDQVLVRSTDGGKTFGEPVYISEDGWVAKFCPHSGISIATDSRENIHSIWWTGGKTPEEAGIYYSVSSDKGKSFAARELIEQAPQETVLHAQLFVDSRDTVWITWESIQDERFLVFLAYREVGDSGWSPYYQLSDGTRNAVFPVVVSDGKTLYLAWSERTGETSQVKVRTADLG